MVKAPMFFFFFLTWLYLEEEILLKEEKLTGVRKFQARKIQVEDVRMGPHMSEFVLPVITNIPIVWCIYSFLYINI